MHQSRARRRGCGQRRIVKIIARFCNDVSPWSALHAPLMLDPVMGCPGALAYVVGIHEECQHGSGSAKSQLSIGCGLRMNFDGPRMAGMLMTCSAWNKCPTRQDAAAVE